MNILQKPISINHNSAMFFDGVIEEGESYKLATFQDGKIVFIDNEYIGKEIIELGQKGLIDDQDIENKFSIDIVVDKFICIYYSKVNDKNIVVDETLYFDNYDDAIQEFEKFLLTV